MSLTAPTAGKKSLFTFTRPGGVGQQAPGQEHTMIGPLPRLHRLVLTWLLTSLTGLLLLLALVGPSGSLGG